MPERTRTRPSFVFNGSRNIAGVGNFPASGSLTDIVIDNYDDGRDCAPFIAVSNRLEGVPFTQTRLDNGTLYTFQDCCPQSVCVDTAVRGAAPGRPSDGVLAARLAARTSPNKPAIDLPTFIGELRDIPQLIRGRGLSHFSRFPNTGGEGDITNPNANLTYQFGLKPLVSDLKTMMGLAEHVAKRAKLIRRLRDKGLRYTQDMWEGSSVAIAPIDVNSAPSGFSMRYDRTIVRKTKVWGHIRWKPTMSLPWHAEEINEQARRAVLGLSPGSITAAAWELLPWSWMIDYFGSIGDIISLNRNAIPCTISRLCIMERLDNVAEYRNGKWKGLPIPDITHTYTRKSRVPATPTVGAYLPILSSRQISILGSLAVVKASG